MIKANHRIWAEVVFRKYILRLLKKSFHSVNIIGGIPEIPDNLPLILAPNHSTWWDGFFVYLLNKKYFGRKFFIMILEEQLEKYKFFTKLGGFSINKSNPKSIIESLSYTAQLLKENRYSVTTIFPQGELLPNYIKPLKFNRGIEKVVQNYNDIVAILPLSIRIEYLKEEKPTVFFKFGKLAIAKSNIVGLTESLRAEVESGLELIGESIISEQFGQVILDGKISISHKSKSAFSVIKTK